MSKDLPKFHIATNPNEIAAHGPHADGIGRTSFGSHQVRVGPNGLIFDDQVNFNKGFDNDLAGRSHGWGLDADPRCTAMGGYAPRK